jgi:hypothetical protein
MTLDEIDLHKIPQKKVRVYIQCQKDINVQKFSDLTPSCCNGQDLNAYRHIEKTYLVRKNINQLWEKYKTISPADLWNSKMVSFSFLYSMIDNKIMYRDGKYSGIQPGQVLYLNMKLLRGIYNLALAFEIVNVDDTNKIIEFSYVNGGKSAGKQIIQLFPTPEGYTRIIHKSIFKSNSSFRDKALYPVFHNKATKQFHHNVQKRVRNAGTNSYRSIPHNKVSLNTCLAVRQVLMGI